MAKLNLSQLLKLPRGAELKTPRGRIYTAVGLVLVSAVIVGLSTLNPAGSNSAKGYRPGSINISHSDDSSQDYSANGNPSSSPSASRQPISGPMASEYASEQAKTQEQLALDAETSRISNLGRTDMALVAIYVSLNNLLKITNLANDKGDAATKEYAANLKTASNKIIDELEKLAKTRGLAWPTLGVEPSQSDLANLRTNFMLTTSNVGYLESSSSSDFKDTFSRIAIKSVADLVAFNRGGTMPDDEEFQGLIKLIATELTTLSKAASK